MVRDRMATVAIIAVFMVGCGFDLAVTADGGPVDVPDIDATPLPTVGFAQPSMTQDETSGLLMIEVTLAAGATGEVRVPFTFSGSATIDDDYMATPGMLTFALGETSKSIPVMIIADQVAEGPESIAITLGTPTGAMLGAATHTIEIGANTLARVNLGTATSMVDEAMAVTLTLSLDKAANGPTTVAYTVTGGTAQGSGTFADYTLAAGVVSFPTGSTVQTLPLGVVNDSRDELDETLTITLTTSTGVVIGTTAPTQVHTIVDDDAVPAVRFGQALSTMTESDTGTTQVTLDVTLSAASGRTIVVPFSVVMVSTTATNPADYTLVGSTLTFVEGVTSMAIIVNVVGDITSEPTEELLLAIQAPTDGSATLGPQSTRRLVINDNDPWCQGTGNFRVCYPTLPTAAVVLPATINTSSGAPCAADQPTGWSGQGQPGACFVLGTSITMTGTTIVTGSRPLVLVASQDIAISQTLDAAAHVGVAGPAPGAPFSSCPAFLTTPGGTNGAGGGAGATFMTQGGNGGTGDGGTANPAGIAPGASAAPMVLRAGCHGQLGGTSGNTAGVAGAAGGVVYLLAGGTIVINGAINVSGSAGRGGGNFTGGSGAGSGGMIWLNATTINATGGRLMANGGGGAGGGDMSASGSDGSDAALSMSQTPALGGPSNGAGAAGGTGFAGSTPAAAAAAGGGNKGGGGGGGGGGYIKASAALTGAAGVSAGLVQAP